MWLDSLYSGCSQGSSRQPWSLTNTLPHSAFQQQPFPFRQPRVTEPGPPPLPGSLAQRRSHKIPWNSFLLHFQVPGCLAWARFGLRICFSKEIRQICRCDSIIWIFLEKAKNPQPTPTYPRNLVQRVCSGASMPWV